jgi:sugar/nucleoside kinase (ribokinase family)
VDVLAFGSVFLEFVFGPVPALPGPGEEVYAQQFAISCGGGAVSVATAAREVGATAGLATVLGDDFGSGVIEAHCARAGVDTSACRRVAGSMSGVTVVLNYAGDRSFLSHLPPRARTENDPAWWPEAVAARRPAWVYLYASPGAMPVIHAAREIGCKVAVDTEPGTIGQSPGAVLECAAAADIFLPNHRELALLTGSEDLKDQLKALNAPDTTVIVTEGAKGAVVVSGGRPERIAAGLRDLEVVDRTGAGDAFAGALLGSLARGLDLAVAVAAANAAGSAAVARLGAVGPVVIGG